MRIIFYPEKQDPPRKGALSLDNELLMPGNNEVSEAIASHHYWAELLELGAVKVVNPADPAEPQLKQDHIRISDLTIEEAEPVIEAETDITLLNAWMASDARTGIKTLISRQIKSLEA